MATAAAGRPLVPEDRSSRLRPADNLLRAATAFALHRARREVSTPELIMRGAWPGDRVTPLLIKAATDPATLTGSDWAAPLAASAVADFIGTLGPVSAGSTLLKLGMQLAFGNAATIVVPGIIADASHAGFVQEGAPIPVRQLDVHPAILERARKFGAICVFTREIFEHSVPTIEALVRATLAESCGAALDAALFSDVAGDEIRPQGLLHDVAETPATAYATSPFDALLQDVSHLAQAVAAVGPIVFIAAPAQAVVMRMWAQQINYEVLASGALADGTIVAIAPNALVSATDPVPRFSVVHEGLLHMETSPAEIVTEAGVTAVPVRSLYQTDSIGLRVTMGVSWALRAANAIAFTTSVSW